MIKWVKTDRDDTVISVIPKAGSTSIRLIREREDYMWSSEALNYGVRVGVIRHPLKRLQSMYKFLKHQHDGYLDVLTSVPTRTYEAFIDHTLRHSNIHWQQQVALLGSAAPTIMKQFETLDTWWSDYFDTELPHSNASPDISVSEDYRQKELSTKYRRDIDLWQSLGDLNGTAGL